MVIESNNKLYVLKRKIRKTHLIDLKNVQEYMEYIHTEHVLQDAEFYMFCNTVDDVEFEEI